MVNEIYVANKLCESCFAQSCAFVDFAETRFGDCGKLFVVDGTAMMFQDRFARFQVSKRRIDSVHGHVMRDNVTHARTTLVGSLFGSVICAEFAFDWLKACANYGIISSLPMTGKKLFDPVTFSHNLPVVHFNQRIDNRRLLSPVITYCLKACDFRFHIAYVN